MYVCMYVCVYEYMYTYTYIGFKSGVAQCVLKGILLVIPQGIVE